MPVHRFHPPLLPLLLFHPILLILLRLLLLLLRLPPPPPRALLLLLHLQPLPLLLRTNPSRSTFCPRGMPNRRPTNPSTPPEQQQPVRRRCLESKKRCWCHRCLPVRARRSARPVTKLLLLLLQRLVVSATAAPMLPSCPCSRFTAITPLRKAFWTPAPPASTLFRLWTTRI